MSSSDKCEKRETDQALPDVIGINAWQAHCHTDGDYKRHSSVVPLMSRVLTTVKRERERLTRLFLMSLGSMPGRLTVILTVITNAIQQLYH